MRKKKKKKNDPTMVMAIHDPTTVMGIDPIIRVGSMGHAQL
jgi:hypothetical protein